MKFKFHKYQGTGNDFIIIDNRDNVVSLTESQINSLCDRKFGIGADGLMLLENHKELDFFIFVISNNPFKFPHFWLGVLFLKILISSKKFFFFYMYFSL